LNSQNSQDKLEIDKIFSTRDQTCHVVRDDS